jgi:ABC-type transport system involved in multi-copper enzyme maturation permease subunit
MNKLLTIAANTFTETLRQPVYAVIIVASLILFVLMPALTMYSLDDDNKFLREIGLSTLFLTSLFISIFAASGAVAEEIDNKTITTVVTKPVQRPIFLLAKFLGVAGAVGLAHYLCTIALLMVIRHGVMETVNDTHDWSVIITAAGIVLLAILITAFFNYFYDWKFSSTAIVLLAVFATVGIVFLAFFDRNWQFNPSRNAINLMDIYASILLFLGAMVITALAVALSSRFNVVVTLAGCVGLFMIGLISDYTFGRFADSHIWANIAYHIVPNLQVFWVSDAIYEGSVIPGKYIIISGVYALCYTAGILSLAVALFQRRQVG